MNKKELIAHLNALLEQRIENVGLEIGSLRTSQGEDTKSSAGDKHEVGRAMMQQELDKLDAQLARSYAMQRELHLIGSRGDHMHVRNGSLVSTSAGIYFISIGLGPVDLNGQKIFVISAASPIGQALKEKRSGETFSFNGKDILIHSIE